MIAFQSSGSRPEIFEWNKYTECLPIARHSLEIQRLRSGFLARRSVVKWRGSAIFRTPMKTLRIAILGAGGIAAKLHLPELAAQNSRA